MERWWGQFVTKLAPRHTRIGLHTVQGPEDKFSVMFLLKGDSNYRSFLLPTCYYITPSWIYIGR